MKITLWRKRFCINLYLILFFPLFYIASYLLYNSKTTLIHTTHGTYKCYIADNIFSQSLGYMFRCPEDIDKREGILFKFKSIKQHKFWMKNVNFDIKLIDVTNNKEIALNRGNEITVKNSKKVVEIPLL